MEFDVLVKKRHMVRAFKSKPVEEEKIEKILKNAHQAPSAGFLQPQEFVLVRDQKVKEKLVRAALDQEFIADAPVVIVTCADTKRSASRYGRRGIERYSIIDAAYASLLILLTAVNEGLGACFVGAFYDEEVSKVLRLPQGVIPIGIIPIGYSAQGPERYPRIPLEKILHKDGW